jgi:hypothetical protein
MHYILTYMYVTIVGVLVNYESYISSKPKKQVTFVVLRLR